MSSRFCSNAMSKMHCISKHMLPGESTETDASGNKKLPQIGEFMKKAVNDYFKKQGEEATVK